MKILLTTDKLTYQEETGYAIALGRALLQKGNGVQICCTGGERRRLFQEMGIESYIVKFNLLSFRKLLNFLREFSPDLIHIQGLAGLSLGLRLSDRLRIPSDLTVHGLAEEEEEGMRLRLRHPRLLGIVAINEVLRESLVNRYGVPKQRIRVIAPGVDLERFRPPAPGLENDRIPVVGTVGRFEVVGGQEFFLRAARMVLDRAWQVVFALIGEGPDERRLRRIARDLGLRREVTFSGPLEHHENVYRLYDIVVIPAIREGVGLTALEAMATGKPVVASGVGEHLNLIENERTGLVFPNRDVTACSERIIRLLGDASLRERLGEAAREFVEETHPLSRMVAETLEFYVRTLEEAGGL